MAAGRTINVDEYTCPACRGLYILVLTPILTRESSSLYGVKLSVVKHYVFVLFTSSTRMTKLNFGIL
jgi:hypothetical protein